MSKSKVKSKSRTKPRTADQADAEDVRPIFIFYLANNPGRGRQPITVNHGGKRVTVYLRAQPTWCTDLSDALDAAKPRKDETVMNTHYIPPVHPARLRLPHHMQLMREGGEDMK